MNWTGEKCLREGTYKSMCVHNRKTTMQMGDYFPPCPEGNEDVEWVWESDPSQAAQTIGATP